MRKFSLLFILISICNSALANELCISRQKSEKEAIERLQRLGKHTITDIYPVEVSTFSCELYSKRKKDYCYKNNLGREVVIELWNACGI